MKTSALPSGTVAFLFSDIEGSTRRWEAYGDAMRDALRRHDEILRSEIEARRGYVFKTIGDAFCAAFWSVGEALYAAVAAQRRLVGQDFRAVDELRVRMAIAAGEVDERDGDYFGVAVNRIARLLSVGHGGQILVAGSAAGLLGTASASDVTLRHLGTLTLRDVKEPEAVYQAIASGLSSAFRPLRALETPPNNLPRQATTFVGRERDVIELESLLETEALVTIVGVGGMGKTRLALEVASGVLNDRKDGVWFVDLASISDEGLVVSTLLSLLGVEQKQEEPPLETLVNHLKQRERLLLVDNCEHMIGEVARVAATIVSATPHTTILATSREALDIAGEVVYRLSTLDQRAAVKLFNERAAAADRKFSPQAEAEAVEDICRRLDGIALAIELAAARVRTMPIRTLAKHLELRTLSGGRDRHARQQTMRALIDWSYNLLTPEERDALRRLAPCMGGFTLESAIALSGGDDATALDLVSSLLEKSLLVLDTEPSDPRYRMLEPIRQYAYEKLDEAGETDGALECHARAFAAIAHDGYEEWDTDPAPDWLERMQRELPNFRAAFGWSAGQQDAIELSAAISADVAPLFLRLARESEGIEWCEYALRPALKLPAELKARVNYMVSMLYNNRGDVDQSFAAARESVRLFQKAGDVRGSAQAHAMLTHRLSFLKRFDEAKESAREALELARASGDSRLLADGLRRSAQAFIDEPDKLRIMYDESVAISRSLGRTGEMARALAWWGAAELELGNYSDAAPLLEEARQHSGDELALNITESAAACYALLGDLAKAGDFARECFELSVRYRHKRHLLFAICYVAAVGGQRDPRQAVRLIAYAEKRLPELGFERLPHDRAIADALKTAVLERLPEHEFNALSSEGEAMSEDEAIARSRDLLSAV